MNVTERSAIIHWAVLAIAVLVGVMLDGNNVDVKDVGQPDAKF